LTRSIPLGRSRDRVRGKAAGNLYTLWSSGTIAIPRTRPPDVTAGLAVDGVADIPAPFRQKRGRAAPSRRRKPFSTLTFVDRTAAMTQCQFALHVHPSGFGLHLTPAGTGMVDMPWPCYQTLQSISPPVALRGRRGRSQSSGSRYYCHAQPAIDTGNIIRPRRTRADSGAKPFRCPDDRRHRCLRT